MDEFSIGSTWRNTKRNHFSAERRGTSLTCHSGGSKLIPDKAITNLPIESEVMTSCAISGHKECQVPPQKWPQRHAAVGHATSIYFWKTFDQSNLSSMVLTSERLFCVKLLTRGFRSTPISYIYIYIPGPCNRCFLVTSGRYYTVAPDSTSFRAKQRDTVKPPYTNPPNTQDFFSQKSPLSLSLHWIVR